MFPGGNRYPCLPILARLVAAPPCLSHRRRFNTPANILDVEITLIVQARPSIHKQVAPVWWNFMAADGA